MFARALGISPLTVVDFIREPFKTRLPLLEEVFEVKLGLGDGYFEAQREKSWLAIPELPLEPLWAQTIDYNPDLQKGVYRYKENLVRIYSIEHHGFFTSVKMKRGNGGKELS